MPGHPPSQARAVVQDLKSGRRSLEQVTADARSIQDPSFAAEALMAVSQDARVPLRNALAILNEVASHLAGTEREWRRAEAIAAIAPRLRSWRADADADDTATFVQSLVTQVMRLPAGQPRSQAILAVAPAASPAQRADLLAVAAENGATALDDAKRVLDSGPVANVEAVLGRVKDATLRARLGAYARLQGPAPDWAAAASSLQGLPSAARVDVLRGLVAAAPDIAGLQGLAGQLGADPEERARVLLAIGARADRLGDRAAGLAWFAQAEQVLPRVPDAKAQAAIRRNLAQGYARSGDEASAQRVAAGQPGAGVAAAAGGPSAGDATDATGGADSVATRPQGAPAPGPAGSTAQGKPSAGEAPATGPRHLLGLYDTYEGGLSEVHLRAVARAAPLCVAFDLDLGLFGFPIASANELVRVAARETNIGAGVRHLEDLAAAGRIQAIPCSSKEPPADWDAIGYPVATTERPEPSKQVDFAGALDATRRAGMARVALLMGLGKRGLPASLLKAVPAHLELTGRNISMETATAMGVMAERLRQLPRA